MRKISVATALLFLSISLSGCLKTRAELKQEDQNGAGNGAPAGQQQSKGTPSQVQNVDEGSYAVDEIKSEMTRMNGRIDDLEHANKDAATQGNQTTKDEFKKIDTRITELEQAQATMLEAIKKMQETQAVAADPLEAFESGRRNFDSQNYDMAIEQLSGYLKAPKGKHSEEATFLRGESYFQLKQYKKSIVDFSKFPELYTHSKLMPQALLRIGQSFEALGMKEDATGFYQELVEKYPKAPEAKKARAKLK